MPDLIWDIRSSDGGATGLPFARARIERRDTILAHALPSSIDVDVTDEDGVRVAAAFGLRGDAETPMARLTLRDGRVERAQIWPGADDLETPVILAGGEVGILTAWWNADDQSEWRWSIELHNRRS